MNRSFKKIVLSLFLVAGFLVFFPGRSSASDKQLNLLERVEPNVTKFALDNGLTVLVYERHRAPVASFVTYVDAGAVNESWGRNGLAHVFEHMAFKGTKTVGTTDYEKEKKILNEMDRVFRKLRNKREKNPNQKDEDTIQKLEKRFQKLKEKAGKYVVGNEYSQLLQRKGGTGLNAATSYDATRYMVSLPSDKMELWFALESERFLHPVLREFYTEKDVVKEEKRSRENRPISNLFMDVTSAAYRAHPYGIPIIGTSASLTAMTREDALEFFRTFYVPEKMTIAISGDVDPETVREYAEQYFSRLESRSTPEELKSREPEPEGKVRVRHQSNAQPALLYFYQTVPASHPDYSKLQVLSSILGDGRTSRLHRRLVSEKQLAMEVNTFSGYPGKKFTSQLAILAMNNKGVKTEKLEKEIQSVVRKIREEGVRKEEIQRAITNMRAGALRSLKSNMGMAMQLAESQALFGNWREQFQRLNELEEITPEMIQEVAREYLVPKRRTTGILETEQP